MRIVGVRPAVCGVPVATVRTGSDLGEILSGKGKRFLKLRLRPIYFGDSYRVSRLDVFSLVSGEERVMSSGVMAELDLIEELRLRRWAREHYVPSDQRQHSWHPIIRDEMARKDVEAAEAEMAPAYAWSKV